MTPNSMQTGHVRRRVPAPRGRQEGIIRLNQLDGNGARQSSAAAFLVDAADFDGTDSMNRVALGTSSKTGIVSYWIKVDTITNDCYVLQGYLNGVNQFDVIVSDYTATGAFQAFLTTRDTTGILVEVFSSTTFGVGAWHHVLIAWDTATATVEMYLDGLSVKSSVTTANRVVGYSGFTNWWSGADRGGLGGSFVDGGVAELYFAPGQFLDITNSTNRDKFRSAAGKPVDLGATGSLPTGSAPLFYQHLSDGEAPANFATNRSGAGNFTISGTLTTYASSPSD